MWFCANYTQVIENQVTIPDNLIRITDYFKWLITTNCVLLKLRCTKPNPMKINIAENSIDANDLKAKLEAKFPDYKLSFRSKNLINIAKSSSVGCTVLVRKKSLIINGNFPSMGASMVFMLCVVLLGFIIPLIIYFAAFHTKMKVVEKEVVAYVKQEYNLP